VTRILAYRKSLSLLFLLAYLMIGSGVANALILCQESEAYSHLEYNLAGTCLKTCSPAKEVGETGLQTDTSPVLMSAAVHCQDTRVFLSHVPASGDKNLSSDSVSPDSIAFHLPPVSHSAVLSLTRPNLLAQPPPSQALFSLRTVVLLI
jgi:hypothetical protein